MEQITYIVRVVHGNNDTITNYSTKAEALSAAVLAWDEQKQTDGFVAVYADDYMQSVVMAFEDRSRKALEALIPEIEEINHFLVELQVQSKCSNDAEKRKHLVNLVDTQFDHVEHLLHALSCAGFPTDYEVEELEVPLVSENGTDTFDYYDQFSWIRVGRWSYYVQEKRWVDMRPEGDFPAPRSSTFEPNF